MFESLKRERINEEFFDALMHSYAAKRNSRLMDDEFNVNSDGDE
jgi:hypothetical protein